MQVIKQEILDAVGGKFLQGDSFRMLHRKKMDGTVCSQETDDPAMVVTRVANAWVYHCHRCHCSGSIGDTSLHPGQTRARIEALKKIPVNKVTEKVDLPRDFLAMRDKVDHDPVPWEAYHWLWRYQLHQDDILRYKIGWSEIYKRVIIPIYEFAHMGDAIAKKLVGWVGRDVQQLTKLQRKVKRVPKYLTRAKKGRRRYFMTMGDTDTVVICEDCISAIKVNLATGYCAVALLNTDVGDDLLRWLRGRKVFLWLDGDMLSKSIKMVDKMRQLGLDAKRLFTTKDPKDYNSVYIMDVVREGERRGDETRQMRPLSDIRPTF